MSFVTTQPEELTAAAGKLQGIGSTMAAENAAAATATTDVVPAAADEVSALQATQFAAYGSWYQQVSAQAQAIHEAFVNTLVNSAGSYGATEAANASTAGSPASGISGLLGALTGSSSSSPSLSDILGDTGPLGLSGSMANIGNIGFGNWAAGSSDLLGLAGGALYDPPVEAAAEAGGLAGLDGAVLAGAVGPAAGSAGFGGAPVLAGMSQASSIGGLSVPPTWAAEAAPAVSPGTATTAGWTTAAPHTTPVTTVPAGMPAMASAGRGGVGFGVPRYGVKPTVMPKPAVV